MPISSNDYRSHYGLPSNRDQSMCSRTSIATFLLTLFAFAWNPGLSHSQDRLVPAAEMFPADTQALIRIPNSEEFLSRWNATQLGKLAADTQLKEFWETQRQEIQHRLADAGWQLSLKIDDFGDISGGQTSMGWIARPKNTAKPFSIALVVDIAGRKEQAEKLMERIDGELKAQKAEAKKIDIAGASVSHYTLPKIKGELRIKESYYTLSKDQFIASDDVDTIKELLAAQSGDKSDSLAKSDLYKAAQAKLSGGENASENNAPELEYFVQPIGFANLLRSISGKSSGNQVDLLKILDNRGFSNLKCVVGELQFSADRFDVFHQGYLFTGAPLSTLPESVQILDFPNVPALTAPAWINAKSAGVVGISWDLEKAFLKFEGIVNDFIGGNQFLGLLDDMKKDANGPQIDIVNEVLPLLSTEIFMISEVVEPITPDSKRTMIVVRLKGDSEKAAKLVDRFGKSEPNGTPVDYEGHRIWRFSNEEEEEVVELEFGTPGANDKEEEEEDEENNPLLKEWAISIIDGYFVFASDAGMITEVVDNVAKAAAGNSFADQPSVKTTQQVIEDIAAKSPRSFTQINLTDRSFEMQYELFRQNILPQNRSLAAMLLDRIFKPRNQNNGGQQQVNGAKLPPFSQIRPYFTPSGLVIRTEDNGWSIQSFVTAPDSKSESK